MKTVAVDYTRSQSCQKAHVVEIEKECNVLRIRAQVRQRTKFLYRQHGEVQVNAVKVRSPIISPLKCAHIFEEQTEAGEVPLDTSVARNVTSA